MQIQPSYSLVGIFLWKWTCGVVVVVLVGPNIFSVIGHSSTSCNFGSLTGKDEFTSFYFAIFSSSHAQTNKEKMPTSHLCTFFTFLNCQIAWKPLNRSRSPPVVSHVKKEWWADPWQHYPRAYFYLENFSSALAYLSIPPPFSLYSFLKDLHPWF